MHLHSQEEALSTQKMWTSSSLLFWLGSTHYHRRLHSSAQVISCVEAHNLSSTPCIQSLLSTRAYTMLVGVICKQHQPYHPSLRQGNGLERDGSI